MTNAVTTRPGRWARFKNADIVYYFLRDKVAMFSFAIFVLFVLATRPVLI
jgi:peptide/nickel transport system permease protein